MKGWNPQNTTKQPTYEGMTREHHNTTPKPFLKIAITAYFDLFVIIGGNSNDGMKMSMLEVVVDLLCGLV